MSSRWNDEQRDAITHRGSELLVAAAAGSGKTAVLVERLISRVIDERVELDRFLVVTFTRAAAEEMRSKIADRLTALVSKQSDDRFLRRQLRLLPRAHISTVHGFCTSLLRENFQAAGLSPDFRVADVPESDALLERALIELIESRYDRGDAGFLALVDALSAANDDEKLLRVTVAAYRRMLAHVDPHQWANEMRIAARTLAADGPDASDYAALVRSDARHTLRYHLERYQMCLPLTDGKPRAILEDEQAALERLLDMLDTAPWDALVAAFTEVGFSILRFPKGYPKEDAETVKAVRNEWKKTFVKLCETVFSRDAAGVREDAAAVLPVAEALLSLVLDLDAAFTDLKRRRNLADFNDLEHLTLDLLRLPDGSPSPLAVQLSRGYAEIMVDEYQDSNAVQDAIFSSLAHSSLFMVGDMKQSIYRFRLADPTIFLRRYTEYPDAAPEHQPRRVILSKNYRSRADVLEACNTLFSAILSPAAGELAYTEREYLYPGRAMPETDLDSVTELALLDLNAQAAEDHDAEDPVDPADTAEDADDDTTRMEARYIASRIAEMYTAHTQVTSGDGTRPVRWSDFAILSRSMTRASVYTEVFRDAGVPLAASVQENLFETPEAELALSLLRCADNPRQDIALTAIMRSPLFDFSADELAALRVTREGPFYEAVCTAVTLDADTQPDPAVFLTAKEKARAMLTALDTLREDAQHMPLSRFLWHAFTVTGLLRVCAAMSEPDTRRSNLLRLLEHAERYESAGYRGLYRWLGLVERMDGGSSAAASVTEDAVRMMTIHASKGLQYPIVFICGCGKQFNLSDLDNPVLLHPRWGIGLRRRIHDTRTEYRTLPAHAIRAAMKREAISEEMRVLYVAMTRAEEKLILVAAQKNLQRVIATCQGGTRPCPPREMLDALSPLTWLLRALLPLSPDGLPFRAGGWYVHEDQAPGRIAQIADMPADESVTWDGSELRFVYPYASAVDTPSKLTATELRGSPMDRELQEDAVLLVPEDTVSIARDARPLRKPIRPRFLERLGLTPSERGTALHLAMQFCRYEHCLTVFDAAQELERLTKEAYLTQEQAAAVDPAKLTHFFLSPLGQRLRQSRELHREFKFSLEVDPAVRTDGADALRKPDGDSILLQGVIDCFFLEDDGWVVVDFKTDYVRPGSKGVLADRYRPQLQAYAHSLSRATGMPVREAVLYLFSTGEALSVKLR